MQIFIKVYDAYMQYAWMYIYIYLHIYIYIYIQGFPCIRYIHAICMNLCIVKYIHRKILLYKSYVITATAVVNFSTTATNRSDNHNRGFLKTHNRSILARLHVHITDLIHFSFILLPKCCTYVFTTWQNSTWKNVWKIFLKNTTSDLNILLLLQHFSSTDF